MDYKGGKFKKLGGQGVDGNDLLGFSKEDLHELLANPILGTVLYNTLHRKPTQSLGVCFEESYIKSSLMQLSTTNPLS